MPTDTYLKQVTGFFWKYPVHIGGCVVAVLSGLAYFSTVGLYNPGYADSDEIITVGYLFGVAHPPGYPLMGLLIKLFSFIPLGSVAFQANVLNIFLSIGTLIFLYLIGVRLLKRFLNSTDNNSEKHPSNQYIPIIVSTTGTLVVGFSFFYWLYSIIIEVFSLNNFLAMMVIWLALLWVEQVEHYPKKLTARELYLFAATCLVGGLGVTNVQSFALLFPGLLVLFLTYTLKSNRWKLYIPKGLMIFFASLGFGVLGPNLLLFLMNANKADVSWYFPQNFSGWIHHIRRQDYNGFQIERGKDFSAYVLNDKHLSEFIAHSPNFVKYFVDHIGYFGVFLGLIGMYWIFKQHKKIFWFLFTNYLLVGLFVGLYLGHPFYDPENYEFKLSTGVSQRQHLLGEVVWGIFIIGGLGFSVEFIKRNVHIFSDKLKYILILFGFGLIISYYFAFNIDAVNQRNNTLAYDYATTVLENLEPNAVLFCSADFSCFSLLYARYVENIRPDVAVITRNAKYPQYFLERNPDLRGYEYFDNPYFTSDILSWNYGNRPVYLTDATPFYIDYMGMDGNPFYLIPETYTFRLTTTIPDQLQPVDYSLSYTFMKQNISEKDYWLSGMKDYFSNFHNVTGIAYSLLGKKGAAVENFSIAIAMSDVNTQSEQYLDSLAGFDGLDNYKPGYESSNSAEFVTIAQQSIDNNQFNHAYEALRKASYLDPLNLDIRNQLADILILGKYYGEAADQYSFILKYYPNKTEFRNKLEQLKSEHGQELKE